MVNTLTHSSGCTDDNITYIDLKCGAPATEKFISYTIAIIAVLMVYLF